MAQAEYQNNEAASSALEVRLFKRFITLIAAPLFWLLLYLSIGETIYLVWLAVLGFYIPGLIYLGAKIGIGKLALTPRLEAMRAIVMLLGMVELGLLVLLIYYSIFTLALYVLHDALPF